MDKCGEAVLPPKDCVWEEYDEGLRLCGQVPDDVGLAGGNVLGVQLPKGKHCHTLRRAFPYPPSAKHF